jgi:hypothetical protein
LARAVTLHRLGTNPGIRWQLDYPMVSCRISWTRNAVQYRWPSDTGSTIVTAASAVYSGKAQIGIILCFCEPFVACDGESCSFTRLTSLTNIHRYLHVVDKQIMYNAKCDFARKRIAK